MSLHPQEIADALKLHDQALDSKCHKSREVKGKGHLPALVQQRVIFDVVVVEVIGERVKAMPVVSALKQDCR